MAFRSMFLDPYLDPEVLRLMGQRSFDETGFTMPPSYNGAQSVDEAGFIQEPYRLHGARSFDEAGFTLPQQAHSFDQRFPMAGDINSGSFVGDSDAIARLRAIGAQRQGGAQSFDEAGFDFPQQQQDAPPPALSAQAYAGSGPLYPGMDRGSGAGVAAGGEGYDWGRALNNAGAWLMASDTGGKSLGALDRDNTSHLSTFTGPNGVVYEHNKKTGRIRQLTGAQRQLVDGPEDIFGNKQKMVWDGQRLVPASGGGSGEAAGGADMQPIGPDGQPLEGKALLEHWKQTRPADAAAVEALLRGDLNLGQRHIQKYARAAALVDPSFQQYDYNTRRNMQVNATTGKIGQEAKATGTVMKHADRLLGTSSQLGGSNIAPTLVNKPWFAMRNLIGDTQFQKIDQEYDTNAKSLGVEVAKVLTNGNVTALADRHEWRDVLDKNKSPVQRAAAIQKVIGLVYDRLQQNEQQYQVVFPNRRLEAFSQEDRDKMSKILAMDPTREGWGGFGKGDTQQTQPAPAAPAQQKPVRIKSIIREED